MIKQKTIKILNKQFKVGTIINGKDDVGMRFTGRLMSKINGIVKMSHIPLKELDLALYMKLSTKMSGHNIDMEETLSVFEVAEKDISSVRGNYEQ